MTRKGLFKSVTKSIGKRIAKNMGGCVSRRLYSYTLEVPRRLAVSGALILELLSAADQAAKSSTRRRTDSLSVRTTGFRFVGRDVCCAGCVSGLIGNLCYEKVSSNEPVQRRLEPVLETVFLPLHWLYDNFDAVQAFYEWYGE